MSDHEIKKETMRQEKLISLDLAKQLFNAGVAQESKWYWMFNDTGKFWDCVTGEHLAEYKNKKGLKFYSAFRISKLKE
jgi:hypothetical protein